MRFWLPWPKKKNPEIEMGSKQLFEVSEYSPATLVLPTYAPEQPPLLHSKEIFAVSLLFSPSF